MSMPTDMLDDTRPSRAGGWEMKGVTDVYWRANATGWERIRDLDGAECGGASPCASVQAREGWVGEMAERQFPVMWPSRYDKIAVSIAFGCPRTVPLAFIEQWHAECLRNHDQTPEQLARRGGLAPNEIVALAAKTSEDRRIAWKMPESESVPRLLALLKTWEDAREGWVEG